MSELSQAITVGALGALLGSILVVALSIYSAILRLLSAIESIRNVIYAMRYVTPSDNDRDL